MDMHYSGLTECATQHMWTDFQGADLFLLTNGHALLGLDGVCYSAHGGVSPSLGIVCLPSTTNMVKYLTLWIALCLLACLCENKSYVLSLLFLSDAFSSVPSSSPFLTFWALFCSFSAAPSCGCLVLFLRDGASVAVI
ncbi:hypothetical protein KP509_18G006000 [Ceratopteris richardii]|uniref:Uncharacterized protein n=1 Tax=Ceratopteris richardii TaxID=49495 RepID=A0A8T2SQV8_CERRI|nr:hypothetical protein KP509_18G006000 [Ceratopteris richardii]